MTNLDQTDVATETSHRGPALTPVWGTAFDRRAALVALVGAALATGIYTVLSGWLTDYTPGWLEIVGTATSLACVWITRRQNVLCMPIGLVSVVAMGTFFFEIELVGQGWLHLGYYVPIQFLGWWIWIRGGETRTDKPVSWLAVPTRVVGIMIMAAGTVALARVFEALHGPSDTLLWDSSIVAASIAAQGLLTLKRVDAWWLWLIPVDVSAVILYAVSGAYLFAALYTLYLVLAALGLRDWTRAWRAQQRGLTAMEARMVS